MSTTVMLAISLAALGGDPPADDLKALQGTWQVVAMERASRRHVFLAHAGDAFSPTLLSGFDQGEHVIDLLNTIRPDAFVPGNHEYDFGPDVLRKRIAAARFPILAANLRDAQGRQLAGVSDTRMLDVQGAKIGVVGLTAQDSAEKSRPGDLHIANVVGTLRDRAAMLRNQGADLVVAIVHGDREIDRAVLQSRTADVLLSGDHLLGNITTTTLVELVTSPRQRAFGAAKRDTLPVYCRSCEVRFACNGECPKNRFTLTPDGEPGLNYLCEGYYRFYDHIQPTIEQMGHLLDAGRPAADVMVIPRDERPDAHVETSRPATPSRPAAT